MPEMDVKTKYAFLIINKNITESRQPFPHMSVRAINGIIYANYHPDSGIANEKRGLRWWKLAVLIQGQGS